jgi:hypothetical protein
MEGTVRGEWMRAVSAGRDDHGARCRQRADQGTHRRRESGDSRVPHRCSEKQVNQYWVEIHKKYAMPVACVFSRSLGAPIGIMSRKGGFGIAAT